jgi:nicotinamidase-related amidase
MRQEYEDRGGRTAVMVIDVQNAVVQNGWDRDGVIERIGKVIDAARETAVPVVYVQHEEPGSGDLEPGAEGWHIHAGVAPLEHEPIVHKRYGDSFMATNLPDVLAGLGVGHLVITGAQSNACVRATTTRALQEGYDVTLVGDAHTTDSYELDGVEVPAESMIADLNALVRFASYPEATGTLARHTEAIAALREGSFHVSPR